MSTYDPDLWLESAQRAIAAHVRAEIDASLEAAGNPIGLQVYEIVFGYPEASELAGYVESEKTLVHFSLDDIDNRTLGMGLNQVKATEDTLADPDTITWEEGQGHVLNYDVGVWASDKSGGPTSRLRIIQALQKILNTSVGKQKLREVTEGVEVIRFNGGRMIVDRISDVRVFRVIDAELVVRVFSRVLAEPSVIVDTEPVQEPDTTIDGITIS